MKIVAAVLAAGASRRLGRPKALVRFRGEPLVARALAAATTEGIADVALVLGANADAIDAVVPPGIVRLPNVDWDEGIASSIRVAVAWAERSHAAALALLLADQPLVDVLDVERLVARARAGASAVGSAYAGTIGAPAVFARSLFPSLRALTGDRGAGALLRAQPDLATIACARAVIDVDQPEDIRVLGTLPSR